MKRQFRIRPYDPNRPRKPRSEAQERASARAFTIARLRGLWYLVMPLSANRREAVRAIIDAELIDLGAEPQRERHQRERSEFEQLIARRRAEHEAERFAPIETHIPF